MQARRKATKQASKVAREKVQYAQRLTVNRWLEGNRTSGLQQVIIRRIKRKSPARWRGLSGPAVLPTLLTGVGFGLEDKNPGNSSIEPLTTRFNPRAHPFPLVRTPFWRCTSSGGSEPRLVSLASERTRAATRHQGSVRRGLVSVATRLLATRGRDGPLRIAVRAAVLGQAPGFHQPRDTKGAWITVCVDLRDPYREVAAR